MRQFILILLFATCVFSEGLAIAIEDTSVYNDPSKRSNIIYNLNTGDSLKVLSMKGKWLLVQPKNEEATGYLNRYKVSILSNSIASEYKISTPLGNHVNYEIITIQEYPHLRSFSVINLLCQAVAVGLLVSDVEIDNKTSVATSLSIVGGTFQTLGMLITEKHKVLAPKKVR